MSTNRPASKAVQRVIARADNAISKAVVILLKEIEKQARAEIIRSPKTIKGFSMIGGRVSFSVATDQGREADLELGGLVEQGKYPNADNIAQLLDVYDYVFRLSSCYPMFIRRDAATGELIKLRELES